jgi:hypothetical protein
MKKEFIKIGIALLILFAIAIPLSLHREKKFKEEEQKIQDENLISVDIEKMEKIQVTNSKGTLTLEKRKKDATGKYEDEFQVRSEEFKDASNWLVISPYRAMGDSLAVNSFLDQVKELKSQKEVQPDLARKSDYELDKAKFTISFFEPGQTEAKLIVNMGAENPSATGYYFSVSDKPGVYLADRIFDPYLKQDLQEWREKRVIGIKDHADLEKISARLVGPKSSFFELVQDKEQWDIVSPEKIAGDTKVIKRWVSNLEGLRSTKILSDPSQMPKHKDVGTVQIKMKDREPLQLTIYEDLKNSMLWYIKRSDLNEVFLVNNDRQLLPTFQNIVDKSLLPNKFEQIQSLRIIHGKFPFSLIKDQEGWKVTEPFQDEANMKRIEGFVQELQKIEPTAYLPQGKIFSPKNENMKIEYSLDDQTKGTITMYIEGGKAFAKTDTPKVKVFSLNNIPSEFSEHLSHMRNDDLLPVVDERLQEISLTVGQSKVEIQKAPKLDDWYLKTLNNVSPTLNMKWKEQLTAQEFYNRLNETFITIFIDKPDPSLKFEKALLEIQTDDSQQITWQFGEKEGEMVYVYSPKRKVVGKIPYSKFKDLITFLEEPKKTDTK